MMDDNARQQRKHVSIACTKCREAHRCCDGEIPCRRCRSRNLQCVYDKSKEKPRRIADKNVTYVHPQHYRIQNAKVAQASSIPQAVPQADINAYLNYYALEFNKTAHFSLTLPVSCTLLPQSFPISMSNIREDQKFRVCSALALTALGMGHTTQGHVLMDQAKKYVPEALESCTVDAAIGFNSLGSCYMMEFQLTPTTNYLKLSKNVALSIWRMQKRDQNNLIVEAANTAPIVVHSLMKLLQLNMTSFNSDGNLDYAINWTQKKLDQLSDVILNAAQMRYSDLHSLAVGLFSLYMADVGSVFQAINNVEVAARNLAWKWQDNSHIFVHLVRSLKFALLKDDLAMRNECGLLLQVFDRMTTHNSTSITSLYTTAMLWHALGLENELQLLVLIAQRMSLSFPGGKFIVERFGEKNAREAEATKWNPFKELLTKVNMANNSINSCLNEQVLVHSESDQDSYPSESKETNSTTDPLYFTFEDMNDTENINNEFYSESYFEPPLS